MKSLFLSAFVLLMVAFAEGATSKPKKVKCKDKKFPDCYQKDLYCPDGCLRDCVVDCSSCQPVCIPPPPPPPKPNKVKCKDKNYKKTCNKDLYCPATCPKTCVADCATCQAICPPLPPTPSYSPPPVVTPSPPPPPAATPSPPPPPAVTPSPPPPANSTPSWPPPPPPTIPSPPPDSSEAAGGKRVRCKNKSYPTCYYREHRCPAACRDQCEVDCVTCSPVCSKFLIQNFSFSYIDWCYFSGL